MKTNRTQYVILGMLSDQAMSGYEIKKFIDLRFSFFWNESYGQLYPQLNLLEKEGSIVSTIDASSTRSRKTYALTEHGKKKLEDWLSLPVEEESVRYEILLKLYFLKDMDVEVMKGHVEEFRKRYLKQSFLLKMISSELGGIVDEAENHGDILRVVDFGQKVYQAYLDWCDETMTYLEKRKKHETKN